MSQLKVNLIIGRQDLILWKSLQFSFKESTWPWMLLMANLIVDRRLSKNSNKILGIKANVQPEDGILSCIQAPWAHLKTSFPTCGWPEHKLWEAETDGYRRQLGNPWIYSSMMVQNGSRQHQLFKWQ